MKTTSIVQDNLGYVWIGTRNGLNKFDGENISSYFKEDGLPHDRVHDIAILKDGRIVVLTYKGLSFFNGKSFENYEYDFFNAEYRVEVDRNDRVWIFTFGATYLFDEGKFIDLKDQIFQTLISDKKDTTDYLLQDSAIYKFDGQHFILITKGLFRTIHQPMLVSNDPYVFLEYDSLQRSWNYSTLENGIIHKNESLEGYLNSSHQAYFYVHGPNESFQVKSWNKTLDYGFSPFIRIVDAFVDRVGNIWIADENGFSIIQNSPFRHYPYRDLPYVWNINQDRNGHYWAASFGHGLWTSKDGLNFSPFIDDPAVNRMRHFLATSSRDENQNLYFGHVNGILKYDGEFFEQLLSGFPVYALQAKKDQLYLGGLFGLAVYNMSDGQKRVFDDDDGLHKCEYIQNIALDKNGNIWAGSYNGVSKVNANLNASINYTFENGRLPSNGVYCSYLDEADNFWLGGDHGLLYYDDLTDSIVLVKSDVLQGMVKSIIQMDENHLLIGAKDGLFVFDITSYKEQDKIDFEVYNVSNGYQGLEPGFTGMYKDSLGQIWICSASSVDVLINSELKSFESGLLPKMSRINDDRVALIDDQLTYHVEPGISSLKVECDAVGLVRPKPTLFQYRIDGGEWSDWSKERVVTINDLDHGDHDFEVRVGPADDQNEIQIDKLNFNVNLPFYDRAIFPVLAFSLTGLLMLFAFFMYFRQRRENKKYVQQLAASRFLRSQLLLSELNPHFIFNILSSIQHKVLLGDREQAADYVVKLSKMIRSFLTASHQSHRNLENYRENDISLEKELELLDSYLEFEKMKSDDHFDYEVRMSKEIYPSQIFIPPMLIQPFVENAIKHGLLLSEHKGLLTIDIYYIDEDLVVVVEDNGIGRLKASELKKGRTGHVSLGTMIIDQRIDLLNELGHKLDITTEDVIPHGTRVIIRFKE